MTERSRLLTAEEKRGGYSGSSDASKVNPPEKLPSDSVQPASSGGSASSETSDK